MSPDRRKDPGHDTRGQKASENRRGRMVHPYHRACPPYHQVTPCCTCGGWDGGTFCGKKMGMMEKVRRVGE